MKEQPFGLDITASRANLRRRYEQQRQAMEQRRHVVQEAVRAAAQAITPRFSGILRLCPFSQG